MSRGEKCKFHVPTISFLEIPQEGIIMDDTQGKAVTEWPTPHAIKDLQCILGFANFYHRFIQCFSSIAAPLTALLKMALELCYETLPLKKLSVN